MIPQCLQQVIDVHDVSIVDGEDHVAGLQAVEWSRLAEVNDHAGAVGRVQPQRVDVIAPDEIVGRAVTELHIGSGGSRSQHRREQYCEDRA